MNKRIYIISFMLASLAIYAISATAAAAFANPSREAVSQQSSYSLTLEKCRGTIYDRNLSPLTNGEKITKAVCLPTEEVFRTLKFNAAEKYSRDELSKAGLPFSLQVSHILDCEGMTYYESSLRYSGFCSHLMGYTDGSGAGISGIEKVFDERLKSTEELKFVYTGDALGKAISKGKNEIKGSSETASGIALTIDKNIQSIAEEAAALLDKGAVVVMEVGSSDIVASVSRPDFDPDNVGKYLDTKDSPLLNRSLASYTPGSVFKLVLSAAALEEGINPKEKYNCKGNIEVEGMKFHCYGGKAHGKVNLHTALQNSCNCYFIELSQKLELQDIYAMALNMGLGTATELYPGLEGDSGYIGSIPELQNRRALANFAIGQGDIRVTPLQMSALVGSIANNGVYSIPDILEGYVDEDMNLLESKGHGTVRIMSPHTAKQLRDYMASVVKFGTGRSAYSDVFTAGAKTGTAQTGVLENGAEKLNYWFCGYAGKTEAPEYVIIVLREGTADGHNPCPEVFKMIAESLF